jgi:hypothetical protein
MASIGWGTWAENVASWIYARGSSPSFLLLRYEDIQTDPEKELRRVAKLLNIEAEPAILQRAVVYSSAERMRKLEKLQYDQWLSTQGYAARRAKKNRTRKDIPFVGKAVSGSWQDIMSEQTAHRIESIWGEIMTTLGYELATFPKRQSERIRA